MGRNNQTKMICSILMFSMLCGIAFASTAMAGNCVDTLKKDGLAEKAKVRIKNNTDMTFSVKYFRNDNLKNTLQLPPGDKDHQNFGISAKFDTNKKVVVTLKLDTGGSTDVAILKFTFRNEGNNRSYFKPTDSNIASLVELCATCTIACQKSWNSADKYWNVKYTINP